MQKPGPIQSTRFILIRVLLYNQKLSTFLLKLHIYQAFRPQPHLLLFPNINSGVRRGEGGEDSPPPKSDKLL